ncbi:hypothetical protein GDO78_003335, partial [Eleutherodactylus coqui]
DAGLSATADVTIRILEVKKDNPSKDGPISDKTDEHLCTPRREGQRLLIPAWDRKLAGNSIAFVFGFPNDATLLGQWKVTALNGTHAYLSMAVRYIEPAVHHVPIVITGNGTDPLSRSLQLRVTVCRCNTHGDCKIDVDRMDGMPTLSSALGIILGTLAAIGLILIIIFCHLAHSPTIKKTEAPEAFPLRSTA